MQHKHILLISFWNCNFFCIHIFSCKRKAIHRTLSWLQRKNMYIMHKEACLYHPFWKTFWDCKKVEENIFDWFERDLSLIWLKKIQKILFWWSNCVGGFFRSWIFLSIPFTST
jgi:hypothetical protein